MTRIRDTLAELLGFRTEDGELSADRRWTGLLWTAQEGFTWRDDLSPWPDERPGPFLVAAGEGRNHYEPLTRLRQADIEDGFAALADRQAADDEVTDALREGIRGYANRFGFLGVGQGLDPADGPVDVGTPIRGESIAAWADELADYRALRTAWTQAARAHSDVRRSSPPPGVGLEGPDLVLRVGGASVRLEDRLYRTDSPDAILEAVAYVVSEKLSKQMRPGVRVGKPLRFQPTSLLGVIYLGFALQLGDPGRRGKAMVHCHACGNLITQRRRNQRYCDGNCRQKAHRMGIARTAGSYRQSDRGRVRPI